MLRAAHGQSSTSQPQPLAGPGSTDHVHRGRLRRRRQHAAEGRLAVERQWDLAAVDPDEADLGQGRERAQAPPQLHSEVRRHALRDLDQDRRLAGDHPAPEPEARRRHAPRRPAGQALEVTGRARLAAVAALAAAALIALSPAPSAIAAPPPIRAPAAILVEPATGDVIFQRDANRPREIASTTKLMTVLLTLERTKLSQTMTAVPYHPLPAESVIGLRAGERLTVADLLRGVLLASANDAAATLAARVGGSRERFVRLMNRRARQLGLRDTHYANPIGLDEAGNHSSAEDLVKLTLILRRNRFFRALTNRPTATLRTGSRQRTVLNRNLLVRQVRVVNGVKTGHTSTAGYVLVGSATRNGVTVVSAVLGDPSESARAAASLPLLRYGLGRYHRVRATRRGATYATAKLAHRDQRVALVATRTVRRTVRRGERITTRILGAPRQLDGPLPAGARVGTIEVRWRGHPVDRVALVTARAVSVASVTQRAGGLISRTLVVLAAAVLALGSLQVVLLRRRVQRRRSRRAGGTEVA